MEWLIVESQAVCQSSATPHTQYKVLQDKRDTYYKTKIAKEKARKEKKRNKTKSLGFSLI